MQVQRGARGSRSAIIDTRRATAALVTAIAALGVAPAANAAVREGRVIEVQHGRDLVILDGYAPNKQVTVEVRRRGVPIAGTLDKRYKTSGTGFLEINHDGTDCFDGDTAPDIRPGDVIRTTVAGEDEHDSMVVQNVSYDGQPIERTVPAEVDETGVVITPERGTGIYEVIGTALADDGVTPLEGELEVRLNHPQRADWAATGRKDWRVPAHAGPDGRYVAEFDTAGRAADKAAVADAEVSVLWGRPVEGDDALPRELSGYDGPGSACNPAPNAGITYVTPVVNMDLEHVTVQGYAPADAAVTVDGTEVEVSPEGGWTATIPAAALEDMKRFTVTAVIDGVPYQKHGFVDRTPPAAPTANLIGGAYDLPQTIHLSGDGEIRYTTDGSEPGRTSSLFTADINVTAPQTIKAVAIDSAGNMGPVATFAYTQKPAPVVVVPKPEPRPEVSEKPVETVREVAVPVSVAAPVLVAAPVELAALPVAAPVATPVKTPAVDRVLAPRSVKLRQARRGVTIMVSTDAASIRAKASKGGRVTARFRRGVGFKLTFKASRRGIYRVTITPGGHASRVVTIRVR